MMMGVFPSEESNQSRLRCFFAVEVVNPDGRVNENHLSNLISSRLPDHLSFPRNFLISF